MRPRALALGACSLILLGGLALIGGSLAILHRTIWPFEQSYGNAVVSLAARLEAGNAANPLASNPRAALAGRDAYTGSCATCHGANGDGKGELGSATFPPATDLTAAETHAKSDAELFWIIKHGLSFTAMPGFEDQYPDTDLWAMVSYLRALQGGQAPAAIAVPTPTAAQLAEADPQGDAAQRGAAVYFAQGCAACHGAVGDAPGNLGLRGAGETGAIRRGQAGMPAYGADQISSAQLTDLEAYMSTFSGQQQGLPPGQFRVAP